MPLRYLQLPGQDLDHDLVSVGGLYAPENSVGKGAIDGSDFDWNNWMQWDELVTPDEALEDNGLCSPDTYFSDLESPVTDGRSTSLFSPEDLAVQDAPLDIDEETESMSFSPTCTTDTIIQLPTTSKDGGFLEAFEAGNFFSQMKRLPAPKPTRIKISRSLQIDTAPAPRRGRKRKASAETEEDPTCLSKKRGHNAIEKRYRYAFDSLDNF
jgi:hypothetical protein